MSGWHRRCPCAHRLQGGSVVAGRGCSGGYDDYMISDFGRFTSSLAASPFPPLTYTYTYTYTCTYTHTEHIPDDQGSWRRAGRPLRLLARALFLRNATTTTLFPSVRERIQVAAEETSDEERANANSHPPSAPCTQIRAQYLTERLIGRDKLFFNVSSLHRHCHLFRCSHTRSGPWMYRQR